MKTDSVLDFRPLDDAEKKMLETTAERVKIKFMRQRGRARTKANGQNTFRIEHENALAASALGAIDEWKVAFIRQGDFTFAVLHVTGVVRIGVAKRNWYLDHPNPITGQRQALRRAFVADTLPLPVETLMALTAANQLPATSEQLPASMQSRGRQQ